MPFAHLDCSSIAVLSATWFLVTFWEAGKGLTVNLQTRTLYGCVFSSVLETPCFSTLHVEGVQTWRTRPISLFVPLPEVNKEGESHQAPTGQRVNGIPYITIASSIATVQA